MELQLVSKKHGIYSVLIDDEDYSVFKAYTWYLDFRRKSRIYLRASVLISKNTYEYLYFHRIITNCPKDKLVDHIDLNTLNNQKSNLRIVTNSENLRNQPIPKSNKSGYKGVYLYKSGQFAGRYSVSLVVNKKRIWGGYFDTDIEAAKKYNELALIHHGEFAYLNEIPNE